MTTFVEHVHCSRCGKRCSGVDPELGLVVRAWVECPECLELTARVQRQIPPRLHEAIQRVIRETRGFNERAQEAWCHVCRRRDHERLHHPDCPIYELHGAWEETLALPAVLENARALDAADARSPTPIDSHGGDREKGFL